MATGISVTKNLQVWTFQNNSVERPMDNAAYSAAHPDDTLVLAGPPRWASVASDRAADITAEGSMLAIGMLQNMQFSQTKPTQPMMAIGSGRSFFVSGKAQTQWTIGRLFVNGRNLLRVLYHNYRLDASAPPLNQFDDRAGATANAAFVMNLDSELFYSPFGLLTVFRNKVRNYIGAMYAELSMINSYAIGVTAGQNMILENVSGLSDRILPVDLSTTPVATGSGGAGVSGATLDAIISFTDGTETGGTSDDSGNI